MSDLLLTAMYAPATQVTYDTIDGTPYRSDDTGLIYARPQHVTELQTYGFTVATLSQMPAGDPLQDDTGWAVAN